MLPDVCSNRTARGIDRAQELSRHIRIAKQQPPIVMAALLNHLFSAQASLSGSPSIRDHWTALLP